MLAIMNPDDKAGLEAALRLKDEYGAEVTVLTMGLPKAVTSFGGDGHGRRQGRFC
jgi:electron transfer flavoprotein alpha/beta subunit